MQSVIVPRGTVLPPPPPGVRYVTVPGLGIVIANDRLRARVDRYFHWPMIVLAILILPLLVVDFTYLHEHADTTPVVTWWAVRISEAAIWLAFLVEFVIKEMIAESRFEYARRNWIDIVIIVLPLLRPLRVARLARTSRVFRLRGVGMKVARYVLALILGLKATDKLLSRFGVHRSTERKDPAKMTRYQLMDEVRHRRKQVDAWEAWHAIQVRYLQSRGMDGILQTRPGDEEEAPGDDPPVDAYDVAERRTADGGTEEHGVRSTGGLRDAERCDHGGAGPRPDARPG
ncbi:MAG: ion transporter [Phycisphaerales bacterium]|nr:ion transporter [Phycisphaerales bacterium]